VTASTSSAPAGRILALPIAVGCCATAAALYVAALDPSSSGTFPACAFRSVTGWWCPGCGLTRATHDLLHGDLAEAFANNALVVPVLAMLILTWGAWLGHSLGRRPAWIPRAAPAAWAGLAIVALAFAILRNLAPFESLRG
jgi:Protein of unknown function (DUF2752)